MNQPQTKCATFYLRHQILQYKRLIPYPLEISMCIRSERKCRPKYTSTVKVRAVLVVRLSFPLPLNRFSMVNYTECIKPRREEKILCEKHCHLHLQKQEV